MADILSQSQRHKNMVAIHSASTKPELKLRHALWQAGFRYRINDKKLPGKPDIVLPKYRTVIFVNGCFWHGHQGCKKYTIPQTNTEFWTKKISRNQERDQEIWRHLNAMGWNVIIIWECELTKRCLSETLSRVSDELQHNLSTRLVEQKERKESRAQYIKEQERKKAVSDSVLAELKQPCTLTSAHKELRPNPPCSESQQ